MSVNTLGVKAGRPSAELASAPGIAVFGVLPKTAFMEVLMYTVEQVMVWGWA
jgi:hypothetical protein